MSLAKKQLAYEEETTTVDQSVIKLSFSQDFIYFFFSRKQKMKKKWKMFMFS